MIKLSCIDLNAKEIDLRQIVDLLKEHSKQMIQTYYRLQKRSLTKIRWYDTSELGDLGKNNY